MSLFLMAVIFLIAKSGEVLGLYRRSLKKICRGLYSEIQLMIPARADIKDVHYGTMKYPLEINFF
jgi:hypothetical protein